MSEQLREQISALTDDSLPEAERRLLLERLGRDAGLRAYWGRTHLISDALRQHLPERLRPDMADRVMAALADEPVPVRRPSRLARWARPVAGLAVAASVASVAVLSLRPGEEPAGVPVVAQQTAPAPAAIAGGPAGGDVMRVEGMRWDVDRPAVADRLNGYLVNHNEFAGSNGVHGVLPYARIVGYDGEGR